MMRRIESDLPVGIDPTGRRPAGGALPSPGAHLPPLTRGHHYSDARQLRRGTGVSADSSVAVGIARDRDHVRGENRRASACSASPLGAIVMRAGLTRRDDAMIAVELWRMMIPQARGGAIDQAATFGILDGPFRC